MDVLIQQGTIEDIDEIIKLKKDVWNEMENKDWYEIETENKAFLVNQLENNGLILKAVKDNKIIGFLIVENNINKERDIIKNMKLKHEANRCIEFCSVAVALEYRGNNLYTQMAKKAEKFMVDNYDIKYILATVHPDNIASVKSLLDIGYDICCKTKMYGNKDRYILMKSID